jgi:hypothetical protein
VPTLIALYQLGLHDELTNYIRTDLANLHRVIEGNPRGGLYLFKHHPEVMKLLKLSTTAWSKFRQQDLDNFQHFQVLLAQNRLWDNKIDDLNAWWLVDPDATDS